MTGRSGRPSMVDVLLIPKVFFIDGIIWGAWAGFKNSWEWFTSYEPLPIQVILSALIISLTASLVGVVAGVILGSYLISYHLAGERWQVW